MNTTPWLASSADGWRGVIGEGFTPTQVSALAANVVASADLPADATVLVTHDSRALGLEAARAVCQAAWCAGAGRVRLVPHLPTPCATAAIRLGHADLALLITASHNPARWNGLKVKVAPGCPPPSSLEAAVARRSGAAATDQQDHPRGVAENPQWLVDEHLDEVLTRIPDRPTKAASVVVDGLGGVAGEPLAQLCERLGWSVHRLGCRPSADFEGLVPDPARATSRTRAARHILAHGADLGLVLDGDGDRIFVLDHRGRTAQPHELFGLLLEYRFHQSWNIPGAAIAVTASTGTAVRRVAGWYGSTVRELGIGFKHLSPLLASGWAEAAGGSVGDLSFVEFGLDRDPFAVTVLLSHLLAHSARRLAHLIDDLRVRVGPLTWFETLVDGPVAPDLTAVGHTVLSRCRLADDVCDITHVDGVKFWLTDGQWMLLRASTTEGGVRLYGELSEARAARELTETVRSVLSAAAPSDRQPCP